MLDVVLQVAIGGALRIAEPRRNKDSNGDEAVGMHVEKAEDLGLGESEGVPYGAGLEGGVFRQLDDELHAQRPLAAGVALGQAEALVEALADCAHGAVADDRELRAHVHAGQEAAGGRAQLIHALIGKTDAGDAAVLGVGDAGEDRRGDGRAGPDLDEAARHQLRCDPLVELTDR